MSNGLLVSCRKITDVGVCALATNLSKLDFVALQETVVTDESVRAFRSGVEDDLPSRVRCCE